MVVKLAAGLKQFIFKKKISNLKMTRLSTCKMDGLVWYTV